MIQSVTKSLYYTLIDKPYSKIFFNFAKSESWFQSDVQDGYVPPVKKVRQQDEPAIQNKTLSHKTIDLSKANEGYFFIIKFNGARSTRQSERGEFLVIFHELWKLTILSKTV